ncbi:MAG: pyridoxal phosphate-dependent aminotransferase [Bacteroidales bacterium]|jgi:aspartate aminotransferase|nr:pyridoxal phosphate-dependent aminotransferase [Bacteroidales bacterium]
MPQLSKKAETLPASAIRKLVPYADAAKLKGIKIYHLNIGQPDIETPVEAVDVLRHADMKIVEYTNSAGNLSYRKKLCEYYAKHNINITSEDIIVTNGGSEALQFAFTVCLNPGDEVLIPEPYYTNYNSFAIQTDTVIKTIPSYIENGFALPPIEDFEKAITEKTKAIMVCNPNNPTGYLYSKEELQTLAALAKKHDLFLFADEVYREFCYDGKKHFSVMELDDISQNVILLDSVSKRYSACGARVGTFISKNKNLVAAAMRMAQARLCPPYFGQIFAEAAVDTPNSYFEKVAKEYDLRRRTLVEEVNKIEGCFCPMPTGAFYTMIQLPIDDSDKFCLWLLQEFNYNGETVMLAPATGFYSNPEKGRKQARITYCLKVDDLKAACKCLSEALKVYPGRTNK